MAEEGAELAGPPGPTTCASWIRRSENRVLAVMGRAGTRSCPPLLEIFAFDPKTASLSPDPLFFSANPFDSSFLFVVVVALIRGKAIFIGNCGLQARFAIREEGGDPLGFAVHPSGDEFVCSTPTGCKLYELNSQDLVIKLIAKDLPTLRSVGLQKCLAFSTDGSKFATGSEDGHLRIFHWPSMNVLLDEPGAHRSFRDMDISLDSEFLVSTGIDGSARIWKIDGGVPLVSLTHASDEKIECCRFSRDGTKPFLFCTVQKGSKVVTAVWDISTWKKIGIKRLLQKPISVLSISLDGKYLALGSKDGDICVVEVKKMEISHWSKKLHLGTSISSIEFCPTERVMLSTSNQWGTMVTKLNVPADWKEWQIYLLLLGMFLASLVVSSPPIQSLPSHFASSKPVLIATSFADVLVGETRCAENPFFMLVFWFVCLVDLGFILV